jgi:hypothetical protein
VTKESQLSRIQWKDLRTEQKPFHEIIVKQHEGIEIACQKVAFSGFAGIDHLWIQIERRIENVA